MRTHFYTPLNRKYGSLFRVLQKDEYLSDSPVTQSRLFPLRNSCGGIWTIIRTGAPVGGVLSPVLDNCLPPISSGKMKNTFSRSDHGSRSPYLGLYSRILKSSIEEYGVKRPDSERQLFASYRKLEDNC
jgi:hypothetical protein